MAECPECGMPIYYLLCVYTVVVTDEIRWNEVGDMLIDRMDEEEYDYDINLLCPECSEIVGYSTEDARKILVREEGKN